MIKKWTIYKITSPSGRVYVGRTINFKRRMAEYGRKGIGQRLIRRSIEKYGYENHKFEIIDEFEGTLMDADCKEMFWIRSYMSNICKFPEQDGMNLTDGGGGNVGHKLSDETKAKKSAYMKANPPTWNIGRKTSDETRLKQSLAKKGKSSNRKGEKMPLHQIELLRKINTGRPSWNKGMDYSYMSDEDRKVKFGSHNIGNAYNKGRKLKPHVIEAMKSKFTGKENTKLWKRVDLLDSDGNILKTFPCIKYACKELGVSAVMVIGVCKGNRQPTEKWNFKYSKL